MREVSKVNQWICNLSDLVPFSRYCFAKENVMHFFGLKGIEEEERVFFIEISFFLQTMTDDDNIICMYFVDVIKGCVGVSRDYDNLCLI